MYSYFFFNDAATTEIYTLSLHDALPILCGERRRLQLRVQDHHAHDEEGDGADLHERAEIGDRKSTRLNSSHVSISYAVFCLKKKTQPTLLFDIRTVISTCLPTIYNSRRR